MAVFGVAVEVSVGLELSRFVTMSAAALDDGLAEIEQVETATREEGGKLHS